MYNKEVLEGRDMTKAKLVDIVLELQGKLNVSSATPLTSAELIEKKIALANKAETVTENIAAIQAQAETEIARIKSETSLAIGRETSQIVAEFNSIKDEISDFDKLTESEIAVSEAKAKETKAKIEAELTELEAKWKEAEGDHEIGILVMQKEQQERRVKAKERSEEVIAEIEIAHARALDELTYKNKTAIRDKDEEYAKEIASILDMELVEAGTVDSLKAEIEYLNKSSEDAVKADIAKAVNAEKARANKELTELKHSAELDKAKSDIAIEAATTRMNQLVADNERLAKQVAEIPTVIKEAVAAAKTEVITNVDAGKK